MVSTPLSFAAPKESGKEKELYRVRGANGSSRSLRPVGAVTRPRKTRPHRAATLGNRRSTEEIVG